MDLQSGNQNEDTQRFWISWVCTSKDHRPLSYPPNEAICGWWCTGRNGNDKLVLCAVVDAPNEKQAEQAIFKEWPEAKSYVKKFGWRFIEAKDRNFTPGDRFPEAEWMAGRLNK